MQEKRSPVFVVATANKIDRLPAEFLRKGRFDEIFFVDLPTLDERRPIWSVHLTRAVRGAAGGDLRVTDDVLGELADATEGFSGAEIEQAVAAGLFDAFADRRPVTRDDLLHAVATTVPLSVTQGEQIQQLRAWAELRAVGATSRAHRDRYAGGGTAPPDRPCDDGSPVVTAARGGRVVDF